MKNVTITLSNNAKSFQLCYCTKMHRTETGEWAVKLGDAIRTGKSAKALMGFVPDGCDLLNPPRAGQRWYFRGKRQADGSILDPVRDWEGNLLENVKRPS